MKTENCELFTKAKDTALRYLAYRARTHKEMVEKLADYPGEVIDGVLTVLEEYGYIDDFAFAKDYTQSRVRNKQYGKLRLRRELREKGVEVGIIDTVLSELDFDEVGAALLKLRRKASGILTEHEKKKYSDYLARQGFDNNVINQAFEEYEQSEV